MQVCNGRPCLCSEGVGGGGIRESSGGRYGEVTYDGPAFEKTSTRVFKKALFSVGVTSHSLSHFSTSARETWST